jgi:hypothetical protein
MFLFISNHGARVAPKNLTVHKGTRQYYGARVAPDKTIVSSYTSMSCRAIQHSTKLQPMLDAHHLGAPGPTSVDRHTTSTGS